MNEFVKSILICSHKDVTIAKVAKISHFLDYVVNNVLIFSQAFCFNAEKELSRQPRIVRIGLIQNSIALPTSAHFLDQKKAIMDKVRPMIDAAGASGVNILCLQVNSANKL